MKEGRKMKEGRTTKEGRKIKKGRNDHMKEGLHEGRNI
jgi:hypothetical protein